MKKWWERRTPEDAPIFDSVWQSKREAWADGYNEAIKNYGAELEARNNARIRTD